MSSRKKDAIVPEERDVILGLTDDAAAAEELQKANAMLDDMVRLQLILWKLQDKATPKKITQVDEVADKVLRLIKDGKPYELAGLKDVPSPFLKSTGRFLEKDGETWKELSDEDAKKMLQKTILEEFKTTGDAAINFAESPFREYKDMVQRRAGELEKAASDAEIELAPKDVVLLRCLDDDDDAQQHQRDKNYDQQGGNKVLFNLASQLVTSQTTTNSEKRIAAALEIIKGLDDADIPSESGKPTPKYVRFVVPSMKDDEVVWTELDLLEATEWIITFCFEVFLEKEILKPVTGGDTTVAASETTAGPSDVPVKEPTPHDVLFGRGGMTNSHPGNRRFRDIIALHRPDYIRAIKMDKPAVARKIVRAIRMGTPAGRFLKKGEGGDWFDVGDRTAAEKTSQGLRERSNAEKRQRSELRRALRIRKEDLEESDAHGSAKKAKTGDGADGTDLAAGTVPTLNYVGTSLPVPLSLNMAQVVTTTKKPKAEGKKSSSSELNTEGLPPNAVDVNGNILVTDYDILCGRGGLTNHHKGNKRFRDIVALHRPDYVRAPKIQKPSVARVIVRAIRNGDPPGRFLRKDEQSGLWIDIGDKKAAEKTSQALREKSNEERDKLKRDPAALGVLLPNPATYLAATTTANVMGNILASGVDAGKETEGKKTKGKGKEKEDDKDENKDDDKKPEAEVEVEQTADV